MHIKAKYKDIKNQRTLLGQNTEKNADFQKTVQFHSGSTGQSAIHSDGDDAKGVKHGADQNNHQSHRHQKTDKSTISLFPLERRGDADFLGDFVQAHGFQHQDADEEAGNRHHDRVGEEIEEVQNAQAQRLDKVPYAEAQRAGDAQKSEDKRS